MQRYYFFLTFANKFCQMLNLFIHFGRIAYISLFIASASNADISVCFLRRIASDNGSPSRLFLAVALHRMQVFFCTLSIASAFDADISVCFLRRIASDTAPGAASFPPFLINFSLSHIFFSFPFAKVRFFSYLCGRKGFATIAR